MLRQVDKLDKIGPDKVAELLVGLGLSTSQAAACIALAGISAADGSFVDRVRALGVSDPELDAGLELLAAVVETAARHVPGRLVADLKIARGLDYYTGTVYETELVGFEGWGSVSLRAAATTRWPATARPPTPGSACPSVSPGCWPRCSPAGC